MASGLAKSSKMKRMESKKSHSWWWDSHITPKNNKWLQENLEEMDDLIKRMLKLIEEDADSFAKKAELYFKKRPELVSLVEEFYRMYRALAERYDLVSGELRKNIPSDLQSQGSGISDAASEPPLGTQSPEQMPTRSKSGPRDIFLGSGSEVNSKGDNDSTLDSESESDDSSVNNSTQSNGNGNGLPRKVKQLEAELEEMKEKLNMQREETCENCKKYYSESLELSNKTTIYEEELRVANEMIQRSKEEIGRLSTELEKHTSSQVFGSSAEVVDSVEKTRAIEEELSLAKEKIQQSTEEIARLSTELEKHASSQVFVSNAEVVDSVERTQAIEEELSPTKEKLCISEKEVAALRQELASVDENLKSAQVEVSVWKNKLDRETGEVSKLQDRVARYKTNIAGRDQEIRTLREVLSNANKSLSEENEQLRAEITSMTKERTYLEDNLKELDLRCQSITAAKGEVEVMCRDETQRLKIEINERENRIEEVKRTLNELTAVKDELNGTIAALSAEIGSKDKQIVQMGSHLHQLHMQHVELITAAERAHKQADELRTRLQELETEVQRKQEIINEGAEGKREAIRQLCFSLEHYRSGYHQLRQAVIAHMRPTVMAT